MGTIYDEQKALDSAYLMQTYGRKPVCFVRGEGMYLFDDSDKRYLDCLSGIGAASLGHCHPAVVSALKIQAEKLLHVSNYFYVEHRGQLAKAISGFLAANPADALGNTGQEWRTFFANSGAEGNEGAIKLARAWGHENKNGATTVVTATRSFHGRTLAALFATGQELKQEPFLPEVTGFAHVPLNDIEALKAEIEQPVAGPVTAVMLECVQGEGGVWPCSLEYLREVRKLTLEKNILLILDEVQTGFFRTGHPFAFQNYDIVPDIVSFAKGVGDGVPIAGFSAVDSVASVFGPGDHGSTFGGGPLVCAAAEATLKIFEDEDIAANVLQTGDYLAKRLGTLPHVVEVRGLGLMRAAELDTPVAQDVVSKGLEEGLVLNATGPTTLRFLPPLIMECSHVDELIEGLESILSKVEDPS